MTGRGPAGRERRRRRPGPRVWNQFPPRGVVPAQGRFSRAPRGLTSGPPWALSLTYQQHFRPRGPLHFRQSRG